MSPAVAAFFDLLVRELLVVVIAVFAFGLLQALRPRRWGRR